jgi:hypothetical protein
MVVAIPAATGSSPATASPPPTITISIKVLDIGKPVLSLLRLQPLHSCPTLFFVHIETMPQFLRRIFSDKHLSFRRDTSTQDDVQQSRRFITKNSTGKPETRLRTRLSQLNLSLYPEANLVSSDGASLADSDIRAARPILAPSIASHERYVVPTKTKAPRRKLSKRHRMPT